MNTTTTNTAQDYSRAIAQELDALEFILTTAGDLDPATAEDIAAAYAELNQENTNDDYEAPLTWLNESCLDLKVLRTDNREQTRVEILRTCGGPHCEITRDSNDGQVIAITTYDGTEQATIRNQYPNLSTYLDEIAQ
tara:strand:- start:559 stop:969 length:411 start_codon:yes stop_codon:yes gene_type:complete